MFALNFSGHFPYVILSKIYVYKTFCGCQCFSGCSVMIELVSNVEEILPIFQSYFIVNSGK